MFIFSSNPVVLNNQQLIAKQNISNSMKAFIAYSHSVRQCTSSTSSALHNNKLSLYMWYILSGTLTLTLRNRHLTAWLILLTTPFLYLPLIHLFTYTLNICKLQSPGHGLYELVFPYHILDRFSVKKSRCPTRSLSFKKLSRCKSSWIYCCEPTQPLSNQ